MRAAVLFTIVIGGSAGLFWAQPQTASPQLSYVTTAHQLGVVGYRDPAGAISPDGKHFAYTEGRFIRIIPIGGGAPVSLAPTDQQVRFLEWASNDTVVAVPRPPSSFRMTDGQPACVIDRRLVIPCGGVKQALDPDVDVYGPIAFTTRSVYFASPGENGMVALWTADLRTRQAHRVSSFSRDAYAPSASTDGTVVFKVQSYRTHLADVPLSGGATRQLTTFQSETPSYHPTQPLLAFTYGTWRRVIDDANYPDIAQDIGVIDLSNAPADAPTQVIARSDSEDQAMAWSPNGKWIAFHSHREMSDDVWLRPADVSTADLGKADGSQADRRISFLGRGAEVGWPRWSPDGKIVLFDGARKGDGRSVIYAIGVDQESGAITSPVREVKADRFDADITHAEWLGGSTMIVGVAREVPGRHVIFTLPIAGGTPTIIHRYATEHDFPGLGVSPDGKSFAFAAPASDGYYQIFKKTIGDDAAPVQLTSDPSNKTQPAYSPDGLRVAFTVWSYEAAFWSFQGR